MVKLASLIDRTLSNVRSGKIPKGESFWKSQEETEAIHAEVKALATSFPTFTW